MSEQQIKLTAENVRMTVTLMPPSPDIIEAWTGRHKDGSLDLNQLSKCFHGSAINGTARTWMDYSHSAYIDTTISIPGNVPINERIVGTLQNGDPVSGQVLMENGQRSFVGVTQPLSVGHGHPLFIHVPLR